VNHLAQLMPLDPNYPSRLRGRRYAPATISVQGGALEAPLVVGIVGSRKASPAAMRYAGRLARVLASEGAVIVSGGAVGIDGAAHRGALEAGGRTWVVAPTGHRHCFPSEHAELFAEVARGPGAMIWPFPPEHHGRSAFLARNRVLVTLADAVVVVQAGKRSGALHAARWTRTLCKPLWVVPVGPWVPGFKGSRKLINGGARALTSTHLLLVALGLRPQGNRHPRSAGVLGPHRPHPALRPAPHSEHEFKVLAAISAAPLHTDAICSSAGLSPQATTAALLTLALENVVVEGPPGFFRRQGAHNR
jgi:DNA processing protein